MSDSQRTNYSDLIRAVGASERVALVDVRRIIDAMSRIVKERTSPNGEVVIGRLGTFRGSTTDRGHRLSFRRSTAAPRVAGQPVEDLDG